MAAESLPEGVTTTELLRWVFDLLNDHDVESLRRRTTHHPTVR
jgi:hypothetical protein